MLDKTIVFGFFFFFLFLNATEEVRNVETFTGWKETLHVDCSPCTLTFHNHINRGKGGKLTSLKQAVAADSINRSEQIGLRGWLTLK